ncbi:MAG: flagellar hook-basal body complex protein FliE [Acidobacteriaceae bacterium]|nr:flagellar hook-basal body complex protein FliE [Acidobacteriaceae bacterium]
MSLPINPIRPPVAIDLSSVAVTSKPASAQDAFGSALAEAIGKVQQTQNATQNTIEKFLSGENEEIHQVAMQVQQTQIAFDMFMAVRNKVVAAYQEVMKMQM